ncbi:MAG: hypothetical protein AB8B93_11125 [Pseudomonadales bacterium]
MSASKAIVLIHGHGAKPAHGELLRLWGDGLRGGLERDRPDLIESLSGLDIELCYYADVYPMDRVAPGEQAQDPALDLVDRQGVLQQLAALDKPRRFRRSYYDALPGKSALPEFLADVSAPLARGLGLGKAAVQRRIPECAAYWQADSDYRRELQRLVMEVLRPRLAAGQSVLLIAHGFGSVVAYDSLWQLSQEAQGDANRLHTLLTLGSPLADDTVRAQLEGASQPLAQRYPDNLLHWHNVAAEDDAICHDETVANDFAPLLQQQRISTLQDHLIYNLSVRYGRSDPHHSLGYLIHPKVTELLGRWLES